MELDEVDKKILRELQSNLPIVERPFASVAGKVGITEEEFFSRVRGLIDDGIIRKFGLRIDSKRVGFASTLIAMKVAENKVDEIGEQLSSYEGVTHCYARDHEYNLWFTIIEKSKEELKKATERIKKDVEYEDMLDLPVKKRFKINVKFDIE